MTSQLDQIMRRERPESCCVPSNISRHNETAATVVFNFFSNRAAFPSFPTTGNASRPSPGIMSPARLTRWLFRPKTLAAG